MRVRTRGSDVVISVHSYSNRNTCIFMVFLGLVASWPIWYIIASWFTHAPHTREDWYPAFYLCLALTGWGFLLGLGAVKRFIVTPNAVLVTDGLLRRVLTFPCEENQAIRLQSILSERADRPQTTWLVKLVAGRHEFTLDERTGHQLESRGIAEAVAKALGCRMLEKDEEGQDLTFPASELDLPYVERVKRHPSLVGRPVNEPPHVGVRRTEKDGRLEFTWGLVTPSLLMSMLSLGVVFFLVSAVPPKANQKSYLEYARLTGDYHLYMTIGAVIVAALLLSAGFRLRLRLTPKAVYLQKSMWGVPFARSSMALCEVEEVQMAHTVRGPVVQVVGDRRLIEFRASDDDVAQWLAHEIRAYLAQPGFSCS